MIMLDVQMQAGGPGKIRDIETEELIEDQQQVSHSFSLNFLQLLKNFRNTALAQFVVNLHKKMAANPGA